MDFVNRIDLLLKEKLLKRTSFCELMGLTKTALTDWERRNTIPAADVALKIADYLNVSVRYLVTGEDEKAVVKENLTREEREFLNQWNSFSDEQKKSIMALWNLYVQEQMEKEKANLG